MNLKFEVEYHDQKLSAIKQHESWSKFIENETDDIITYPGFFKMSSRDTYIVLRENQVLAFCFEDIQNQGLFKIRNYKLGGQRLRYDGKKLMLFSRNGSDIEKGLPLTSLHFQNHAQVDTCYEHFDKMQSRDRLKRKIFIDIDKENELYNGVKNIVHKLLHDNEILNISINFIKTKYADVFLRFFYIFHQESKIYSMLNVGDYIYLNDVTNLDREFGFYDHNKDFDRFVEVVSRKYKFKSQVESLLSCWRLLYLVAQSVYSNEFCIQYGEYFLKIDNMNITDCIRQYCSIDISDINILTNRDLVKKFVYFLMKNNIFKEIIAQNNNILDCYEYVNRIFPDFINKRVLDQFEISLMYSPAKSLFSIDDIDLMGGHEFENFVSLLFSKMGYITEVTKGSGDQGVDVIVEKNGKKIGIQTKCYTSSVSNTAIQQVVAGIKHYKIEKGMVITNRFFTPSAQELAQSNNVILWDRNMLKKKIIDAFGNQK